MKTKRLTLIALLLCVLLAGAALAALKAHNASEEASSAAAADGNIPLSAFAAEDLSSISYTYNGQTLTLNYLNGEWTLEQDPAYHLDATACNTMVTALSALNAKRELAQQAGEDYGFSSPTVTISVTAAGQTNELVFGAENSVTGDVYAKKNGEDIIYTVSASKISCFELSREELFGAFNPAGLTASAIEAVSYTSGDGTTVYLKAVSKRTDASSSDASSEEESGAEYATVWRLESSPDAELDEAKVNGILSALSSYVSAQYTGADAASYGLDKPLVRASVTTAEGTAELVYGAGTDGYYMAVAGDNSVYGVDESTVQALSYTEQELLESGD